MRERSGAAGPDGQERRKGSGKQPGTLAGSPGRVPPLLWGPEPGPAHVPPLWASSAEAAGQARFPGRPGRINLHLVPLHFHPGSCQGYFEKEQRGQMVTLQRQHRGRLGAGCQTWPGPQGPVPAGPRDCVPRAPAAALGGEPRAGPRPLRAPITPLFSLRPADRSPDEGRLLFL